MYLRVVIDSSHPVELGWDVIRKPVESSPIAVREINVSHVTVGSIGSERNSVCRGERILLQKRLHPVELNVVVLDGSFDRGGARHIHSRSF